MSRKPMSAAESDLSAELPNRWQMHFLGTGNARAQDLGSSSAVLLEHGVPRLLIDLGPQTLASYEQRYAEPPPALFLTHGHMDHVGGLEGLFYRCWFDPNRRGQTPLYVPLGLIPILHARFAEFPGLLAEDGAGFWDAFRLIPVSDWFWHAGSRYEVFEVRHHAPGTSFGLHLPGVFVFTGDTRPIPEQLSLRSAAGECVFHDCGLRGNPSHTGVDDLMREYSSALRSRLVLYHHADEQEREALQAHGYRVAVPGQDIPLPDPACASV